MLRTILARLIQGPPRRRGPECYPIPSDWLGGALLSVLYGDARLLWDDFPVHGELDELLPVSWYISLNWSMSPRGCCGGASSSARAPGLL